MESDTQRILNQIDELNESMGRSLAYVDEILRDLTSSPEVIRWLYSSDADSGDEEEEEADGGYDDGEVYVAEGALDDDDMTFAVAGPPALARQIAFDDHVYHVDDEDFHVTRRRRLSFDSDGTVRNNYTPWWYIARRDDLGDCSDSETIIDEWEEPVTPVREFLVRRDHDSDEETVEEPML